MKKTTKILSLALCVLMMVSLLAGCGGKGKTLEDIQSAGKLVAATSPDFPPFESLDASNNVVGIEPEILHAVCERLGVELVIEQMSFDSILPGVQAGKYDMGMSGISVTEERQKNILFTVPYCMAAQAIVVKTGSPITCKADLEGKTVSVQSGTTSEDYCTQQGYAVNSYDSNSDAKLGLVTDKVDAWVIDDLTAAEMVKAHNATGGEQLVILDEPMTAEPYAFALKLGSDSLANAVNEVLNELIADGTIAAIFEKYEASYFAPEA